MKTKLSHYIFAIIHSYAVLFFSQNKTLGLLLLVVSFFNWNAGLAGLICTLIAIVYTTINGFDEQEVRKGLYSFNPLLFGIGFGTFYHFNGPFFFWLIIGCCSCLVITVNLRSRLSAIALPYLSLPFILTFWILFSAANSVFQLGLEQKNSSLLNEFGTGVGAHTWWNLPFYIDLYFRALSAVLFQNSALSGLLIAAGILIHSRIAFSATLIGFLTALIFNQLTGSYADGISYYHLGSNFMMTALAVGSFFMIPSFKSYLWSVTAVLLAVLLVSTFTRLAGQHDLPVLSLPFSITTISLLYFFNNQDKSSWFVLTTWQFYSPEQNLYEYLNGKERLNELQYFNLKLPFMGNWFVSQGYDGLITHKSEWGKALDFVIMDDEQHTYSHYGLQPENFYCFNKPVLACGDGVIAELTDHIEDNPIGQANMLDNWGNSIVIRHTNALFSKVSHLKKESVRVKIGDFVKQGDIIALCGNSGRSPEPHLHFQLQATPFIGSKTIAYPFSYFHSLAGNETVLNKYSIPSEGMTVGSPMINISLKNAFHFQPGYTKTITSADGKTEVFEVQTNELNQLYFYSRQSDSYAYFLLNDTSFYFTGFYGDKKSLLYLFYLAAYKVFFIENKNDRVIDHYPLQLFPVQPVRWLNDLVAPFGQFIRLRYESFAGNEKDKLAIYSKQYQMVFNKEKETMHSTLVIGPTGIQTLTIDLKNVKTKMIWA